jgi:hypothetical protein
MHITVHRFFKNTCRRSCSVTGFFPSIFAVQCLVIVVSSCVYHDLSEEVNCQLSTLQFQVKSITPTSTCEHANGAITFTASGGRKPYQFSTDGNTWTLDSSITTLNATGYSFLLKDENGCIVSVDTTIHTMTEFQGSIITTPDSSCENDNGTIEINNVDGLNFLFRVDDGEFTTAHVFNQIGEGTHRLFVQSPSGCMSIQTVIVERAQTGVSWLSDILPIMTTYCSKSGCHDGISRGNDWRIYDQVKANAQIIKQNTQSKNMPFDQLMPQDKIDLIRCWVDDGAPNN